MRAVGVTYAVGGSCDRTVSVRERRMVAARGRVSMTNGVVEGEKLADASQGGGTGRREEVNGDVDREGEGNCSQSRDCEGGGGEEFLYEAVDGGVGLRGIL